MFTATYANAVPSRFKLLAPGQEYVLVFDTIVRQDTGELFRDHCYVSVSQKIYERFLSYRRGTRFTFSAVVYRYGKKVEGDGFCYNKVNFGLRGLRKIRMR